ncbi:2-hydroxyacid dehydrogenase [Halomonas sp. YLGW01]|uniref:2-hydroxyacid dehydrogenase n=1 Tax=Halomonas sp. YLGW01 TaxID=2773308 RepID=UPI0024136627|nr:2-hydroxyacid dehydrogenase [Halomonas sp. YLGW01]
MLRVAMFSAQPYDRRFFTEAAAGREIALQFHEVTLTPDSAVLAHGADGVCAFVNDRLDAEVLEALAVQGVRFIALRCAGFNNVGLAAAERLGLAVARVPAYSPEAVAEHALALLLTLNRRIHRAFNRVREGNFMLEGLLGMTLAGKTVGLIGTGRIGLATARIFRGFGCRLLGEDRYPSEAFTTLGGEYVSRERLLAESDVISLHCPLTDDTRYLIDEAALSRLKPGAILINTSRGGLVDTRAAIAALKTRRLGGLAIDVYEQETSLFFRDHSSDIIDDDIFQRLTTFPNVLITGHQGFFTAEALTEIAEVTLDNIEALGRGEPCPNRVSQEG